MSDLQNILSNHPEPNEDALKKYLEGNASPEERFAVEHQMAEDAFMNDAVEGLQHFNDRQLMQDFVLQINKQIQQQTSRKRKRKFRRGTDDQNWTIIAIILLLVLCTLGYMVIHLSGKEKQSNRIDYLHKR